MPKTPGLTDQIQALVTAITVEKDKLADALDMIQTYSEQLRRLTGEAQQKLIGRS